MTNEDKKDEIHASSSEGEGNLREDPTGIVNDYMNNNPHLQDLDKAINTSDHSNPQHDDSEEEEEKYAQQSYTDYKTQQMQGGSKL